MVTAAFVLATGTGALAAERADEVRGGRRLAERHCGGCHAVDKGPSPLADAPRFRDLHKRYRAGGLAELLEEGMLQPSRMPEEGSPRRHPRMPMAVLGDDEIAQLAAYLKSLEPPRSKGRLKS
ncbi:c-type cytochrome [Caulobacter hibisci]|uniref:c-type cytochrome n=1 Tax=Caulobacter hibisci TaxID=2035993 RepID=UPI001E2FF934|nr:cytochrome c [Caulobacter hibisci]